VPELVNAPFGSHYRNQHSRNVRDVDARWIRIRSAKRSCKQARRVSGWQESQKLGNRALAAGHLAGLRNVDAKEDIDMENMDKIHGPRRGRRRRRSHYSRVQFPQREETRFVQFPTDEMDRSFLSIALSMLERDDFDRLAIIKPRSAANASLATDGTFLRKSVRAEITVHTICLSPFLALEPVRHTLPFLVLNLIRCNPRVMFYSPRSAPRARPREPAGRWSAIR